MKILFIVLCFQSAFISFFLFQSKKGKRLGNRMLALVFLMLSIALVNLYWTVFGIETNFPRLLFIDDTFMFAYGPLLYLFTQSALFKEYRLKRCHLFHFIPFLLFVCIMVLLLSNVDPESLYRSMRLAENQNIPWYVKIGGLLMLLHVLCYLLLSKWEVKRVLDSALQSRSTIDQGHIKTLRFLLNSFILLFGISLVHAFLPFLGFKNGLLFSLLAMVLFLFYFINSVVLKMLNRATQDSGLITQTRFGAKGKYAATKLEPQELEAYKTKVWEYMVAEERYLDSDLKIDDLALELDLPPKKLSQIINEGYSCNFFDFVNRFRVEAAKVLLSNRADAKRTVLEVLYDSGFNSKSSFNTAFKKFTGLTPTEYKNRL